MLRRTEANHEEASGLDQRDPDHVLRLLASGQQRAAEAVSGAIAPLAQAAAKMADCIRAGGRLVYAGAGSSGLMAMADALELPGTYGLDPERVVVLLAGGMRDLKRLPGGPEDDRDTASAEAGALRLSHHDLLIVVSASGATPYALGIRDVAAEAGCPIVAIANNPDAPLFQRADIAVLLATPPEVIAGSTRMGAATAQKIAFNMMSTMAGILLGHVHDGHMVNLVADNDKLRARARRMVSDIAGIDEDAAGEALSLAEGSVKHAILISVGASGPAEASALLAESRGLLRPAMQRLHGRTAKQR